MKQAIYLLMAFMGGIGFVFVAGFIWAKIQGSLSDNAAFKETK